jgi:DNA-binding MarR family transcriptional regulator
MIKQSVTNASAKADTAATAASQRGAARISDVLGYRLALASLTTNGVFEREVGEPLQLRPVEYTILSLIRESPGLTPARLAKALAVSAPNITVWMGKLEARGYLLRAIKHDDRRTQLLSLTQEGERRSIEATQRLLLAERKALAGLTSGEFTLLSELLEKVAAAREVRS